MKKLRQQRGESIAETLLAVLLIGLCTAFFVTAVVTGVRLNEQAKALDQKYTRQLNSAERGETPSEEKYAVLISYTIKDISRTDTIDIGYTGEGGDSLWAFRENN